MSKKHHNNRRRNSGTRGGYAAKAKITPGAVGKVVAVLLAVVAVAYVITSLALGMQWNPVKWFKKDAGTPVKSISVDENIIAIDDNGNELIEGKIYAMPKGIMFMSSRTTSFSSVTVKAAIKPENADDKRVTWTSSDTNSVIVSPNADNSLIATITCLGGFFDGAVYITCTSVENPAAQAVCRIDYLVSADDIELSGGFEDNPTEIVFGNSYTLSAHFTTITPGVGTCMGEVSNIRGTILLTRNFCRTVDSYLKQNGYSGSDYELSYNDVDVCAHNLIMDFDDSPYDCFYSTSAYCPKEAFDNAFKLAMRDCDIHATLSIDADYVYNGKKYGSYSYETDIRFSQSGIWLNVDGVGLDNENVVFGT